MGKLKTQKSVAKRFRITKNKKVLKKKNGQDHFNSREPSKVTRNKRRMVEMNNTNAKAIRAFIPYA